MSITQRRFDLILVGWICAIMCVLPLLEIWVATGYVPAIVRGWIEIYARGGDPLVAHMPFYARYVFIVHAFAFTPLHVLMIVGLVRCKPWFTLVAVAYVAAGLTIDGLSLPAEVVVHVVVRRAVHGAQGAPRVARLVQAALPNRRLTKRTRRARGRRWRRSVARSR